MYSTSAMRMVILINTLFKIEFQGDIYTGGPMNISHIEWSLIFHPEDSRPAECGYRVQAYSVSPVRREASLGEGSERTPAQVTSGWWGRRKKHTGSMFSLWTWGHEANCHNPQRLNLFSHLSNGDNTT